MLSSKIGNSKNKCKHKLKTFNRSQSLTKSQKSKMRLQKYKNYKKNKKNLLKSR